MNELKGVHHVTAITSSAERNYEFFTYVLGMRLVKKTVNQDDIQTYHLFFADDAIQMISTKMLKQFLIPLYKQYKEAVITSEHFKMHLCGDASRHFRILKDELGVNEFETGFPIDFKKIREELGPDVTIHGGPNIMILKQGSVEEVAQETQRILSSGVLEGGKFVLREGNNVVPFTPFENLNAMYQQARNFHD